MPRAIRELGAMLLTLLVASAIIFGAMYAAPGDPVSFLIGNPENITPERVAQVRAEYNLDEPFIVQYWLWLTGALTGDLGTSFQYKQSVGSLLASRLPVTLALVGVAALFLIVGGIALGVIAAVRRETTIDAAIVGGTTLAASVPTFVLGILFVAVFSVTLGWFPVSGIGEGFLDRLHHLVLPGLTLAIGAIAIISRVTRQSMVEQLGLEHVESARAAGLSERRVIGRHVLRNAWGPVLTMLSLVIASMIAGTVAVETVFGISGIGSLLVAAINSHDFPVVQAVLLTMVVAFMVVTTLVDIAVPLLDPRVRTWAVAR